jgi:hypothetical protein
MHLLSESTFLEFTADRLCDQVLTQAPGTIAQLHLGANLLLANGGRGGALTELAQMFPRSRFFGLDADAADLAAARAGGRTPWGKNIRLKPDVSALPSLAGMFHFALRLPSQWGPTLSDLTQLLQRRGQCFDLHREPVDPQAYREAGLSGLRQLRLPDCFCTITRKQSSFSHE